METTGFVQVSSGASTRRRRRSRGRSLVTALGPSNLVIAANALSGTALMIVFARLRGQTRWWSAEGLLRSAFPTIARVSGGPQEVEFGGGTEWVNCDPLSFAKELKGKVVLLHFMTYGCSNCVHALDSIRAIEEEVQDPRLVIVSVSCGKLVSERDSKNVSEAVQRLGIKHCVVNDTQLELWQSVGAQGWPTLALVDGNGILKDVAVGEPSPTVLTRRIREELQLVPESTTAWRPSILSNVSASRFSSAMRYPSAVAIDNRRAQMWISDCGNHRILQLDQQGQVINEFGVAGEEGFEDGKDSSARFRRPNGLAISNKHNALFVADTGNHAIRRIDLDDLEVSTIAGDGTQGFDLVGGKFGADQKLCSPMDVCVVPGLELLIVAMSGSNQLWKLAMDRMEEGLASFSGNGSERRLDANSAARAEWAQPSSVVVYSSSDREDHRELLIADAESNSIRSVSLDQSNFPTRTIAGGDPLFPDNLFAFGDRVGNRFVARFSHPLSVVSAGYGSPYAFVADTYNHRIKKVNVRTGFVSILCGTGSPGFVDGTSTQASFWEPCGLSLSEDGGKLLVADRNNHAIRVVDLTTGATSTMRIMTSS